MRAKIEKSIPKKKAFAGKTDKSRVKFFEKVINNLLTVLTEHRLASSVDSYVVGSPGFVKDEFFEFMKEEAKRQGDKLLQEVLAKLILAHCSSGFKQSLNEILSNPEVREKSKTQHCAAELGYLEAFFENLRKDEGKCCYGFKCVQYALECKAIQTLLISDHLFRSKSTEVRKQYV